MQRTDKLNTWTNNKQRNAQVQRKERLRYARTKYNAGTYDKQAQSTTTEIQHTERLTNNTTH